jgi:hypothetical protein
MAFRAKASPVGLASCGPALTRRSGDNIVILEELCFVAGCISGASY